MDLPRRVPFPIIDAHQHFWRVDCAWVIWPTSEQPQLHRNFELEDFKNVASRAGVIGSLVVQSQPSEEDNAYMSEIASGDNFIRGVVGWTDLKSPGARERILELSHQQKLKGLRPMLQSLRDDWLLDPVLDAPLQAMAQLGLVFDALVNIHQLPAVVWAAKRHPELTFVLDHAAKPPIQKPPSKEWLDHIWQLSLLPNVNCKLSGMVTEGGTDWDIKDLVPFFTILYSLFGSSRLLWGSDWPVLTLRASYDRWLDTALKLCANLEAGEQAAIFGGNARRIYKL